jgi:ADP-ribose pyrophosphatase YjhB (NUDIX family)
MSKRTQLQAQLNTFSPIDTTEEQHLQDMQLLLQSEGDPFSRSHFVPGHFTASAFVLHPTDDALLLIFHSKFERWLQPGGHVDPEDQTVAHAAYREVCEETHASVILPQEPTIIDVDIHDIPARKQEPAHKHFDVRFLFRATSEHFQAASDANDAKWWPIPEISEHTSDPSVMRAVNKIIKLKLT